MRGRLFVDLLKSNQQVCLSAVARLPIELQLKIGEHLEHQMVAREIIANETEPLLSYIENSQPLRNESNPSPYLGGSYEIYVQFLQFAGQMYLFDYSNKPFPGASYLKRPSNATAVIASFDDLGCTDLSYVEGKLGYDRIKKAPWYKTFDLQDGLSKLAKLEKKVCKNSTGRSTHIFTDQSRVASSYMISRWKIQTWNSGTL